MHQEISPQEPNNRQMWVKVSPPRCFVAYYRVSTERQGVSGLGMDAQREAIRLHVAQTGGEVVATFQETESGKRKDRPALAEALRECRRRKATLIIAKLDRLARNVAFIANLIESGVEFVACDNPHANRLMLHLLAAFAEHEREMISERTRAALAVARARGVRLGANGAALAKHFKGVALSFAESIRQDYEAAKSEVGDSPTAIAAALNARGIATVQGGRWQATQVKRLRVRLEGACA